MIQKHEIPLLEFDTDEIAVTLCLDAVTHL